MIMTRTYVKFKYFVLTLIIFKDIFYPSQLLTYIKQDLRG